MSKVKVLSRKEMHEIIDELIKAGAVAHGSFTPTGGSSTWQIDRERNTSIANASANKFLTFSKSKISNFISHPTFWNNGFTDQGYWSYSRQSFDFKELLLNKTKSYRKNFISLVVSRVASDAQSFYPKLQNLILSKGKGYWLRLNLVKNPCNNRPMIANKTNASYYNKRARTEVNSSVLTACFENCSLSVLKDIWDEYSAGKRSLSWQGQWIAKDRLKKSFSNDISVPHAVEKMISYHESNGYLGWQAGHSLNSMISNTKSSKLFLESLSPYCSNKEKQSLFEDTWVNRAIKNALSFISKDDLVYYLEFGHYCSDLFEKRLESKWG